MGPRVSEAAGILASAGAIEAVVFDMDGVLLDSEPLWHEAEIEAFARVGLALEPVDCLRTMGMRVDAVVEYWLLRHPWDTRRYPVRAVADEILDGVVARIRERGRTLPGVDAGLAAVAARGVRRALASSSPVRVIDAVLETLGLDGVFELAVSAQHEPRGKPAPDVYLTACRGLGVVPGRALAVEDSLAGMAAAKTAGMTCVMVPDPSIAGRHELARADLVLDTLDDLDASWEQLEEAVGRPAGYRQ